MTWLNRLLIALRLHRPRTEARCRGHVPPRPMPAPAALRDDDTQPFVRRGCVLVPLAELSPRPRPAPARHLHAVAGSRADNAMGDPWVPPGAYGAAAGLVENGEAPAPAPDTLIRTGAGGEFAGGGANASWGSSDSGCSSGGDSGSSGGCGGSD